MQMYVKILHRIEYVSDVMKPWKQQPMHTQEKLASGIDASVGPNEKLRFGIS